MRVRVRSVFASLRDILSQHPLTGEAVVSR
jgi:hypothetical protein